MEINVNVQTSTENQQSTNDNHNYDNRRSYNNLPLQPGECLVPIRVDWEMVKHFNMCQDNLETWHIGPNKVLVAFAPVKIENKPAALKQFNADVREHFASFKSDDALSQDLLKKIHEINPKYGRILDLICKDYTKGQILDELGLGKSQGYADIKAAQALAKKLYFGE